MIPLQRPNLGPKELHAVAGVFESRWLGMGAAVEAFERRLADFLGASHVIATSTGTAALHLALAACDFPTGSEAIVPSLTYVASVQAIVAAGLQPVFADVDPQTLNISPESIRRCLSDRTGAILPVHYRGMACAMDEILAIAEESNLVVVEDAAHAFGSRYRGKRVGSFGHIACFSFDPIKTITCGEGGAIAFASPQFETVAAKARAMRVLGIDSDTWTRRQKGDVYHYDVVQPGFRYHMPNFCAAIGLAQLDRFNEIAHRKIDICRAYDTAFRNLKSLRVIETDYSETVPFIYIVRVADRPDFIRDLTNRQISTGLHYIPNHRHSYFRTFPKDDLVHTEDAAAEIVTLPLFSEQTDAEVQSVIDAVTAWDRTTAGKMRIKVK